MSVEFKLPKSGMGISEATITLWHKAEGDSFSAGEVIAEAETAKAIEELEAPFDGRLQKILVAEGEEVEVLTVIALLEEA